MSRYLDFEALGARLGRSSKTARRLVDAQGIPTYRIGGRLYVNEAELESWIQAQRVEQADFGARLRAIRDRVRQRRVQGAKHVGD